MQDGSQTVITDSVKKRSKLIEGAGFDCVVNILEWVNKNIKIKRSVDNWDKLFRKRTAAEIIESGFSTGCTDTSLAFIILARAKKVPTKYIEAIKKAWLEGEKDLIEGHVFAEVCIENKWYIVDPEMMTIYVNGDKRVYKHFVIYKKGLDSWDIGIRSIGEMKEKLSMFREKSK